MHQGVFLWAMLHTASGSGCYSGPPSHTCSCELTEATCTGVWTGACSCETLPPPPPSPILPEGTAASPLAPPLVFDECLHDFFTTGAIVRTWRHREGASCSLFNDGAYVTLTSMLVSDVLVALSTLVLVAIGVSCICVKAVAPLLKGQWWFPPFSSVMLLWRITLTWHAMLHASADVQQLVAPWASAALLHAALLVLLTINALLTISICVTAFCATKDGLHRILLTTQAAAVGVWLPLIGAEWDTTWHHFLLLLLCCAAQQGDLLEASLSLLHIICGLQKLNLNFFVNAGSSFFGPVLAAFPCTELRSLS